MGAELIGMDLNMLSEPTEVGLVSQLFKNTLSRKVWVPCTTEAFGPIPHLFCTHSDSFWLQSKPHSSFWPIVISSFWTTQSSPRAIAIKTLFPLISQSINGLLFWMGQWYPYRNRCTMVVLVVPLEQFRECDLLCMRTGYSLRKSGHSSRWGEPWWSLK